ncbi:hypothetical protein CBB2_0863 [Clostridium botulinum]|nr:hypothetical protein CBB2_0863 [Clostridium botulinum]
MLYMIDWILLALLGGIIFKEFRIVKQLVIKTEKRTIDTIFLIIGIVVLFYIIYAYATTSRHYLLGLLGTIAYIVSYLKNGITSKGFVSSYRCLHFVPWNKVKEVHIKQEKSMKISYLGNGSSNRLYFKEKDYDKIIEILSKNLVNDLIIIDHN